MRAMICGMGAITFDTLKFADTLKQIGVPPSHAEADAATRRDIDDLRKDRQAREFRLTAKLGAFITVAVCILIAVMRLQH